MAVKYKDTGRTCTFCHSGSFVHYGDEQTPKCRYCGVLEAKDEPAKRSISPSTAKKVTNG